MGPRCAVHGRPSAPKALLQDAVRLGREGFCGARLLEGMPLQCMVGQKELCCGARELMPVARAWARASSHLVRKR